MELFYCETCGIRIASTELENGNALKLDGLTYCSKCKTAKLPPTDEVVAVPVQTRRPASARMQRQVGAAAVTTSSELKPRADSSKALAVAGVAIGVLALIVGIFIFTRHSPEPARAVAAEQPKAPTPNPEKLVSATPQPPQPQPTVKPQPESQQPEHIMPPITFVSQGEEDAAKAFEAAQREMDATTDKEAQAKILAAFVEKYPDSMQAARASVELARLKDPKLAVKQSAGKPQPIQAPVETEGVPTAFKLVLDPKAVAPGVKDASVAASPPADAHPGALLAKNGEKWPGLTGMTIAGLNPKHALFVVQPGGKIRFRYFAQKDTFALDLAMVRNSGGWTAWAYRIEKPVTGTWTTQEVPFENFKGDNKLPPEPGTICEDFRLGLHGPDGHQFYVDEFEVIAGGDTAKPATAPSVPDENLTSFKIGLEGNRLNGMGEGKAAVPPGASAKAVKAKTHEKHPTTAGIAVSMFNVLKDSAQAKAKMLFAATPGAKVRLRYFDTSLTELKILLTDAADVHRIYAATINDVTKSAWTSAELPLSDLKDKEGKSLSPGSGCRRIEIEAVGAENHEFYLDFFEIVPGDGK